MACLLRSHSEREKPMSQATHAGLGATMDVHVTGRRILAIIVDGIIVGLPTGLMAALLGAFFSGGAGLAPPWKAPWGFSWP